MQERRVTFGLFLICCLSIYALVTEGALAAEGINTTAYTCVSHSAGKFLDAHCTAALESGASFESEAIEVAQVTNVVTTNSATKNGTKEATPTIFKGTIFGVKTEVECKTVSGEGTLTNVEPFAKVHAVRGTIVDRFLSCTMNKPAGFGCKIIEPIEINSNIEGVEGLGAEKNEMGIEFKPTGKHFAQIVIEGCFLKGTFNLDGTAIGTGTPSPREKFSGATTIWSPAMTKETLKLAGNAAEIESALTMRMAPVNGKEQNPITLETAT